MPRPAEPAKLLADLQLQSLGSVGGVGVGEDCCHNDRSVRVCMYIYIYIYICIRYPKKGHQL